MIEQIKHFINFVSLQNNSIKFLFVILLAVFSYFFTKKVILKIIRRLIKTTKTEIDDFLFAPKVLARVSYLAPLWVLSNYLYLIPDYKTFASQIINSVAVLTVVLTISAILTSLNDYLEKKEKYKERPVKGYIEIVTIVVFIFGGVLILGTLVGQSPWAILTGLGALTAILVLVFRDTILSFVASIQISSYDLVKIGDWIEAPKYGADGEVIDISLNVIKILNGDKTITVLPTYKLIEDSFKNWRGIKLSGGRRIKRSVFIDQSSIKFCTDEMLSRFEKYRLISNYLKQKKIEIEAYNREMNYDNSTLVNGRRLTNIGTFRAYLVEYLKQRADIRKDLTFMVRHLPPGTEGLPIEIYVFANTTDWAEFEAIQADIFDHILAVVPQFELSLFQNPTGRDFKNIQTDR